MFARIALSLSALAFAGGVAAAPALGQGDANGQFGITPARRDVVGRPPGNLVPTRVTNTTQGQFAVTVFPVLLTQAVTGDFVFSEKPSVLNAANNILTPSPAKFLMAPGTSRTVSLHWNTLPAGARAAYVGVVFQAVPLIHGKPNLRVTNRLLSINFLRLPGRYRSSGRFSGMQVLQAPQQPRILRFLPRVRNTGQVVDSPKRTSLVIESAAGKHLYRQSWPGDVVLPGASRDFVIDVKHVFGAGDYEAVAIMDFGSSKHQVVKTPFHLTAPNTLPSPAITVANFGATGEIGKPAHLTASVRSTGTAPAGTEVSLSVFRITGAPSDNVPVATRRIRYAGLAPGTRRALDVRLGVVRAGHYRALLRYRDTTDVVHTLAAEFDATKQKSFWDRVKRFFRDHGVLAVGLLALFLLLLIILWFLRRQRRLERELRASPSDSSGLVNINTATITELQALPGVGPKAAERIVEHRDEFGAFGSVDELAKVSGFGPRRVADVRGRATV
jgi:comEA protein